MFDHLHSDDWLPLIPRIQLKILALLYHSFFAKLPSIYVTLSTCLHLPSLFIRYVHLTGIIFLSCKRGLQWLKH